MLALAEELVGESSQLLAVSQSLGQLNSGKSTAIVDADWKMPLGTARRYGVMPGVPDEMMESDLAAVWQYYFAPSEQYKLSDSRGEVLVGEDSYSDDAEGTKNAAENRLVQSWREKGWRPAGHLLLHDGLIYFKTGADLAVWNSDGIVEMINTRF